MAKSNKAASLQSGLLARKGGAAPAENPPEAALAKAARLPHGTKTTVAITVRLDQERYQRMLAYGAQYMPRLSNQDILVSALDAFLDSK